MAVGFSGSNGGIGKVCKNFVRADIEARISKYQALGDQVGGKIYKPISKNTISDTKSLLKKKKEGKR